MEAASSKTVDHASVLARAPTGRSSRTAPASRRASASGRPYSPQGLTIRTAAITTNSTTSVNLDSDTVAPSTDSVPMPTHSALISPMIRAASRRNTWHHFPWPAWMAPCERE